MTVYLDPYLTTNEVNMAMDAINGWNQWALSNNRMAFITITYNNPFAATIVIREDPSLRGDPATGAYFDNSTFNLNINPLYGGRNDGFFGQIMSHEMGHAIGFRDVYTNNCNGQTVMYWNVDSNKGPYYTSPGPTDYCDMSLENPPPATDPDPKAIEPINTDGWWCPGGGCDPLILDLNGDGIQTTGIDDPVWFDLDGDGTKEHLAWTNPGTVEGFLWVNLTGKNRVDNGSELFGIGMLLPDGTRPQDAFDALAVYDRPDFGGNGDGVIDEKDAVWDRLRIWIDVNHDGMCQPGENRPIHAFGIESIPLSTLTIMRKDAVGNTHRRQGIYYRNVQGERKVFAVESLSFQLVH